MKNTAVNFLKIKFHFIVKSFKLFDAYEWLHNFVFPHLAFCLDVASRRGSNVTMGSAMSGEGVSHFASRTSMFSAQLLNQGKTDKDGT